MPQKLKMDKKKKMHRAGENEYDSSANVCCQHCRHFPHLAHCVLRQITTALDGGSWKFT